MDRKKLISVNNLKRSYIMGEYTVKALDDVSFNINEGEFLSIMGTSGSGKSTLMYILGCLDRQSSGEYFYKNIEPIKLVDSELSYFRNKKIGFVFQSFNLLMNSTVRQNIELPLTYSRKENKNSSKIIDALLNAIGLYDKQKHTPFELSGGQCQRVAVARALVNNPDIILADEPTGNLDSNTGLEIMDIFQKLNRFGKTIIMVTHDKNISRYSNRILTVKDGKLISDEKVKDKLTASSNNNISFESIFSGEKMK